MKYSVYKLKFLTGVHFGKGMLNDSADTFHSDTLFSALYIEALKLGIAQPFYHAVKEGRLLFSDAFPYVGEQYMLPKPMLHIESSKRGDSEEKKLYKKLKYIPIDQMDAFLRGEMDLKNEPMKDFGMFGQQTKNTVRQKEETLPFFIGTYYYREGNGLYLIVSYDKEETGQMAGELIESLSYVGIGGKTASGLGKFECRRARQMDSFSEALNSKKSRWMLLSNALPKEEELEQTLEGASYLLEKRSGFVASSTYAEEARKKRDFYVFTAGSCFLQRFEGDIFDVSMGGNHPVYRYAKPLFMGV